MEQKNKQLMIFLAGEVQCKANILHIISNGNFDFYAADGGYILAEEMGIVPKIILGDFDSSPKPSRENILVYPSEKDQTDSELALSLGIENGYQTIWMIAPFGGRFDHSMANICLLESAHKNGIDLKLYDGENMAFMLSEGIHSLDPKYRYVSFFPCDAQADVTLTGFKYSVEHFTIHRHTPIAVSNEPMENPVITVHHGTVLCICIEKQQEEL